MVYKNTRFSKIGDGTAPFSTKICSQSFEVVFFKKECNKIKLKYIIIVVIL